MRKSEQIKNIIKTIDSGMKVILPDGDIIFQKGAYYYCKNDEKGNINDIILPYYLNEKFKKFTFWTTQEGIIYEINEMTSSHLNNTIKHLENKIQYDDLEKETLDTFENYITEMRYVLRERTINNILLDDEDVGIDIL